MSNPSQPYRLAGRGLIDASTTLDFSFDGRQLTGHPGDTLASALLANGVRLVGRSFKYHRPRGILSAGSEEPNALVTLREGARREPNTRATTAELFQGLVAESQNRWPSLRFDLLSLNQLVAPVFAAGFYYKTFMWPAALWEKLYEPLIRRAAGLGKAATEADPDHYETIFGFCDVLVIGAGPAGLSAALAAGRSGAQVILVDEDFRLGGRLLSERRAIGDQSALDWTDRVIAELASMKEVRLLPRTTVFGVYDDRTYGAVERVTDHLAEPLPHQPRQRIWHIVAQRTVLAAGAIERPLVFGDNDRPGVMLASAVRTYVNRFGVAPGKRAVVFANNDDALRTAADLHDAGVAVAAVVDARPEGGALDLIAGRGIEVFKGSTITAIKGGSAGISAAEISGPQGTKRVACDLVAMSGGWNPTVHLTTHLGGKAVWSEHKSAFLPPERLPAGMSVVGAANGEFGLGATLRAGAEAGAEAAAALGFTAASLAVPQVEGEPLGLSPLWQVAGGRGKAFVDFQNDVGAPDIALAEREGFRSVEHLKRYTTLGMATDQGKTANVNGMAMMAALTGRSIAETGTTTFRPPYTPVALGAFAGHHRGKTFKPTRLTPSHDVASELGAVFVETGLWLRAQYFPIEGENDWLTTVDREVLAVRNGVGICDVSTLGKIDIQGADAGTFLDRVYVNTWSTLPVGKARYGLMLREDGIVFDDGTTTRFAPDRFFMTTTTANAGRVMQHLELCAQWLWPELDVQMVSATDQWAQYAVAGPRSRQLIERVIDPGFDVSNAAFPYMAAAELTVCGGIKARLFRLSFSGELAYELAVPARYGDALFRHLLAVGQDLGVIPYGTEALGVMRIEKGHPAGSELNGQTTAGDLGMAKLLSTKKDFVGRVMSGRPGLVDPLRPSLVGIRPVNRSERLRGGAHFLPAGAVNTAENDQGWVTSVAHSPSLGHWIGLGFLKRGSERMGEIIRAYDPVRGGDIDVEVVSPVFIDPQGEKLRG